MNWKLIAIEAAFFLIAVSITVFGVLAGVGA